MTFPDEDAERHYDLAPCGFLTTTPDGLIVKVNQTLLTLTGYSRADLVAVRRFTDLLSAGARIYYGTHLLPMLTMSGEVREIALDLVAADGTRLPVLVNAALDEGAASSARVIRVAIFDATQRRQYERELVAEKQRAEAATATATALARALERTLIPPKAPVIDGLDIATEYHPASIGHLVGGDFYDVFQVGAQEWVVALGDVSGKGTEAAIVTSLARYTIRGASMADASPSSGLGILNAALVADPTDHHCTVVLLRLLRGPAGWRAVISCGGHPLPIRLDRSGGTSRVGRPGTLLGILPTADLYDVELELSAGDSLVLFTDGLSEGRRGADFYGEERLVESVVRHKGPAAQIAGGVLADALAYQDGGPKDDIALVVVQVP